jgi:threonine/homoserine efflux transporter RhtA
MAGCPQSLILAAVFGCAALKSLPQQSLSCLESMAPETAAAAGTAIATHEDPAEIESAGFGLAVDVLVCEAEAIISDDIEAHAVAAANGTDAATVQAHAKTYVASKGISPTE